MIPLTAAIETELAKGNVRAIKIAEAVFPAETRRVSLGDQDVVVGGVTYERLHGWMDVEGLEADSDNVATAYRVKLSAIDPAWLNELYNDPIQGSSVTISQALINRLTGATIDDTKVDLDVRELHIDEIVENENQKDVSFIAETVFVDQMDSTRDARTQAAHTRRHPGDNFFQDVNQIQRGLTVQLTTLVVRR